MSSPYILFEWCIKCQAQQPRSQLATCGPRLLNIFLKRMLNTSWGSMRKGKSSLNIQTITKNPIFNLQLQNWIIRIIQLSTPESLALRMISKVFLYFCKNKKNQFISKKLKLIYFKSENMKWVPIYYWYIWILFIKK